MIVIRRMEEGDAAQAAMLEKACFTEPWTKDAFLETLRLPYACYYAAEEGTEIVGICGLRNISGEGEITNVAVKEKYRRRGIAGKLLARLLEEGERNGTKAFTLEVREGNGPAIELYKKLGFMAEGIRKDFYSAPRENALIMWKR